MEKIKSESGITIISLIITLALIIILLGLTLPRGTKEIETTQDSVQITELQTVQVAVLNRAILHKNTNAPLIGTIINKDDVLSYAQDIGINNLVTIPENYPDSDYYVLSPDELKEIGVDNSKDSDIVNYASGEVINYTATMSNSNNPLYIIGTEKFENDL